MSRSTPHSLFSCLKEAPHRRSPALYPLWILLCPGPKPAAANSLPAATVPGTEDLHSSTSAPSSPGFGKTVLLGLFPPEGLGLHSVDITPPKHIPIGPGSTSAPPHRWGPDSRLNLEGVLLSPSAPLHLMSSVVTLVNLPALSTHPTPPPPPACPTALPSTRPQTVVPVESRACALQTAGTCHKCCGQGTVGEARLLPRAFGPAF